MVEFVSYDPEKHREQFFELNVDYFTYLREETIKNLGSTDWLKNPRESVTRVFPYLSSIKPPEGIILLIMDDGKAVGMGALRKLEEGVGEVKRMFIRPEFQGRGYGKQMMARLNDKGREFGYHTLRLDTAVFLGAAIHIYRSAGFVERGPYSGTELEQGSSVQIFMEKKLD